MELKSNNLFIEFPRGGAFVGSSDFQGPLKVFLLLQSAADQVLFWYCNEIIVRNFIKQILESTRNV